MSEAVSGFGYNFEVEDFHTYHVSEHGVLVHNANYGQVPDVGGGNYILPNAENLTMSQTVQNHMDDIIKRGENAGQLSRPYIDSDGTTLLLKEIMESTTPTPDGILQFGLRWDAPGVFRGSAGTWELVVDTLTESIVHFNFISQ